VITGITVNNSLQEVVKPKMREIPVHNSLQEAIKPKTREIPVRERD
jgi:hypothetical protein